MKRLADLLAAPGWIVFQLLEQCNLRCRMCYEWGENGAYHGRGEPAMLDPAVVLRTVEECLPAKPLFEFFGGEPLLYPALWEVMARIREGGCALAFPTNGTLLEKYAERLVDRGPTRLWISLDGPPAVNDRQRGRGVFERAVRGLARIHAAKRARNSPYPELGIACVVTPDTAPHLEALFLDGIDLGQLGAISIELQSYATREQAEAYAQVLRQEFGVERTPCAEAYVRDPEHFGAIDCADLARQMVRVAEAAVKRGIRFHSQPRTFTPENLRRYFSADWQGLPDRRDRCGVPWLTAEISARGEVSTCHSFYDLSLGNIYQQSLLDIWRGERLTRLRRHLRDRMFPICPACCRYHGGAGALP